MAFRTIFIIAMTTVYDHNERVNLHILQDCAIACGILITMTLVVYLIEYIPRSKTLMNYE